MRAILIDPFACEVREVECELERQPICDLLSHPTTRVRSLNRIAANIVHPNETFIFDAEAFDKGGKRLFVFDDGSFSVPAKGLVVAYDADNNLCAATSSLEAIKNGISFAIETNDGGMIPTTTPWKGGQP